MAVTTNPIPVKTALRLSWGTVGGFRLPMVAASSEGGGHPRGARAPRPPERGLSGTLRSPPLGGLGEIGKNMAVVEYDGRIVVVDSGLMFPTADQLGVDLVLPDFSYLRERAADIEAIVSRTGTRTTSARCPSCCARSARSRSPTSTAAGSRSRWSARSSTSTS